jgi:hypothetical protein
MGFPETIQELIKAGYHYDSDANCRGCGVRIEWYITPSGKKMPLDVDPEGNCCPHFANCPDAESFRKR